MNYLEMIPVRIAESDRSDKSVESVLMLKIPKFKNISIGKLILFNNHSAYMKIHLDSFGSEVWMLIDGKIDVEQICTKLTGKFGEKVQPAEERVTKFLTKLYDNRYITYKQLEEFKSQ